VADLGGFRDAVAALAREGAVPDAADRLIVVPTRAAAAHLVRGIENRATSNSPVNLPRFVTRDELYECLAERLVLRAPSLSRYERQALLVSACRTAITEGCMAPFKVRPGLIDEILDFYDALNRHQRNVDAFERLAVRMFEPVADDDRGAGRLLHQTRFLVGAFRHFEQQCSEAGSVDEHALRRLLLATASPAPWRHVVLTVGDRAMDPHGLFPADWDLLTRIPGLERLDVVATDATVAGRFHERIHQLLPGLDEVRVDAGAAQAPALLAARDGAPVLQVRDREEEVTAFARWALSTAQSSALERMALVVHRPLPYVYLAREVLRSSGVPCQMFDALPLAAEPFAAALDLVFSAVSGNFGRTVSIALLRSPHFTFGTEDGPMGARDVSALDKALSEAGYLGDIDALEAISLRAAVVLRNVIGELQPLRVKASCAEHLNVLLEFLRKHGRASSGPQWERLSRARAAIVETLERLRDAHRRFDPAPVEFDTVAAIVRRAIEAQTFAPRTGETGVHLVDAASAPFGDFDAVQLAGLVDGEWPDPPRRNIFYSPALLRDLGWPSEMDRLEGARAAFRDLLRLPASRLVVSRFALELDAMIGASSLLDEVESARLDAAPLMVAAPGPRDWPPVAQPWVARRRDDVRPDDERFHGRTSGRRLAAYTLSALERYQDCPFKFFAADVLRLEEAPDDASTLSPRARGRLVHEVFEHFFREWDAAGHGAITAESLESARRLFQEIAAPKLARLSPADAALERARLFGSAISVGIVDVMLGLEARRPTEVRERWLEYRLEGDFSLGMENGRRVPLRGVADRLDLLDGRRLRVIDYKSGSAPNPRRALQAPIYALCAQERLTLRDRRGWIVDEAAYIAFSGKRPFVPVVREGAADSDEILAGARERLFAAVDGIERGEFPPRPHDPMICGYCAYAPVCRKDYVGDD
jgi:RecB family exonuclease